MKKLLTVLAVLISVMSIYPTNAEAGKKSPSFRCTDPNCRAWHAGNPEYGGLCPDCYRKSIDQYREMLKDMGCGDQFFSGGGPLKNRVC